MSDAPLRRGMTDPGQATVPAPVRLRLGAALERLPAPTGERFAELLAHGSLCVEIYAPEGTDPQQPHDRDEVYVVARGTGTFWNGSERHPFAAGDVLFVPAGVPHRFEAFTPDFATWVFFFGPKGGEKGRSHALG